MWCCQKQMTCLRKESDSLYAFVMPSPRVNPLLRNKAFVFLRPQIAWSFDKAFQGCLIHVLSAAMINACGFVNRFFFFVIVFWLLKTLFTCLLVLLDYCFLFSGQLSDLLCELLHAFVRSPWPFEVCINNIALLLPLLFELTTFLLTRELYFLCISIAAQEWSKCSICRVVSIAFVLELMVLLKEPTAVNRIFLQEPSKMVLFG
jgi:hypothetical protein